MRLFALWAEPSEEVDKKSIEYDRVQVPEISLRDMCDDALTPIARDGAGAVEVAVRLQKAFESLASIGVNKIYEIPQLFNNIIGNFQSTFERYSSIYKILWFPHLQ